MLLLPLFSVAAVAALVLRAIGVVACCALLFVGAAIAALLFWAIGVAGTCDVSGGCELVWS